MPKIDMSGIKQMENGDFKVRIRQKINGELVDIAVTKDERTGEKFRNATEASNFRRWKIEQLTNAPQISEEPNKYVTFSDMWDYYIKEDSVDKAHATVVKYRSMWNNHIKDVFADRYINGPDAVSVSEINNFLAEYFETTTLAYSYIEGFLKWFYCMYHNAYKRGFIDGETLRRYVEERGSKIQMPKRQKDEKKDEAVRYEPAEINDIYSVFEGSDLETVFLIAYYCGLRRAEVFGLTWDDYNETDKTLRINKQLLYNAEEKYWYLAKCKTLAAERVIDVPKPLAKNLKDRHTAQVRLGDAYRRNASEIIVDTTVRPVVERRGVNFINRRTYSNPPGKLLTDGALGYYAKEIKKRFGIEFKMHSLRKTHLTFLASHGYPIKALMQRAGHKKLDTTMKYYISNDKTAQEQMANVLGQITTDVIWFYVREDNHVESERENGIIYKYRKFREGERYMPEKWRESTEEEYLRAANRLDMAVRPSKNQDKDSWSYRHGFF